MDWRLYADRSRFPEAPQERLFVLRVLFDDVRGRSWARTGTCSSKQVTSMRLGPRFRGRESS
jgi:hypothetical protein